MKASEVLIYVEGRSDKNAMEALLRTLLQQKLQEGIAINFIESPEGDKKKSVLTKVPRRAASIIQNKSHSVVVAMPDLYPRDVVFEHKTFGELEEGILKKFDELMQNGRFADDIRLKDRFRVFCFKHDLEALILASEEALKDYLSLDSLEVIWRKPVECQDHDEPPKLIVEKLFRENGRRYKGTVHARAILENADYRIIAERCQQCFKPFVDFLSNLKPIDYQDHN